MDRAGEERRGEGQEFGRKGGRTERGGSAAEVGGGRRARGGSPDALAPVQRATKKETASCQRKGLVRSFCLYSKRPPARREERHSSELAQRVQQTPWAHERVRAGWRREGEGRRERRLK